MNLEELIQTTKSVLEDNLENDPRIQTLSEFVKDLSYDEKAYFKSTLIEFKKDLTKKGMEAISEKYKNKNYKSKNELSDEEFWSLIEY